MNQNNTQKIAVIGLGFVGLPLACVFATKGFNVIGIDVDANKIASLNEGKSYITDVSDDMLKEVMETKRFSVTINPDEMKQVNAIIICVPTPVNSDKSPKLDYVTSAAEEIAKRLQPGQLVVLESSTFPGTTRDIVKPILEQNGLKAGIDFNLAYSPERVDPGNDKYPIDSIPKVVGGISEKCKQAIQDLYAKVYQTIVPVSSTEAAEVTKLLENTYRFINISFVNEMAILCDELGVNLWEVIEAASTKPYGYHPFYPGPGISGHCIPVDPLYLQYVFEQKGITSRFIQLSDDMNKEIVEFIVQRTLELAGKEKPSIFIYGLTYKKDVADIRDSRAVDIFKQLISSGAQVEYHDPLVPEVKINNEFRRSITLDKHVLESADIVLILTDHSMIPIDFIVQHAKAIYDTRAVTKANHLQDKVYQLGNGVK
ncbi:nucleotide sugar dehydrogenase [Metabacillus niabensis]|uniref:UDP-N-acetyl-D-glucosamine dehydrogenase n=1 Tax=Metabacillus niabensis TaxID=324854 RepID=A0ABT9Z7T0_9BACI|nr:nucleotide sugar dehydrogenase [Metabacillus niabensis]MDQ0227989.1 UDP-N-acetyl-D-glucosamine dehydrogenase [Metabacillus niabensis]